jgi:YggT family protein
MALSGLFRFISSVISIYMVLLFIRILLTWFRSVDLGRPFDILVKITDPYLNYFRRFPRLRAGRMDFSPLVAILVLVVIQNVFSTLAVLGKITIGIFLSLVIGAGWSAVSFFLTFFFIIILIRLLTLLMSRNPSAQMWQTLDLLIIPIQERIRRIIPARQPRSYQAELVISGVALLIISIVGRILINLLLIFLRGLPF